MLIFLHIPKTAGYTFNLILRRLYPKRSLSAHSLDAVRGLRQIPEATRAKADLLQGHFSYGVHTLFPRPAQYVTFLRDPIERVVSLYYYALHEPSTYFHDALVSDDISLAEFVDSSITSEIYNFQVRAIAGTVQPGPPFPEVDETNLSLAKQRLDSDFTAFGITEKFDKSLVLFSRSFGWPLLRGRLFYQSKNVTAGRKQVTDIPAEVIATIRKNNAVDIQLYEYACKLFNQRVRVCPGLRTRLYLFQHLNHMLGAAYQRIPQRWIKHVHQLKANMS